MVIGKGFVAAKATTLLLVSLLASCPSLLAVFEPRDAGARPSAMGGAYTGLANDNSAVFTNPAGLALLPSWEFSTTYTSLYNVKELAYGFVNFAYPVPKAGTFAGTLSVFGSKAYSEQQYIFSHGKHLVSGVMAGYNLKILALQIGDNFGADTSLGIDLGFLARVSPNFAIGVVAKNLNEPSFAKGLEKVPQGFAGGLFYRPLQGVNVTWDLEKVISRPLSVRVGAEFRVTDFLSLRGGVATQPNRFSMGMGFDHGIFFFDYAFLTHATLPGQHIGTLSIRWGRGKETSIQYSPEKGKRRTERAKPIARSATRALPGKGRLDINRATAEEFAQLEGIRRSMAQRIIDWRDKNGPFRSIRDLLKVPRLSRKAYAKIEEFITMGEVEPEPEPEPEKERPTRLPTRPPPESSPTRGEERKGEEKQEEEATEEEPLAPPVPENAPGGDLYVEELETPPILDLNKASFSGLRSLGLSVVQANNVLRFRKARRFRKAEDLLRVPGMTPELFKEIRSRVEVRQ